MSDAAGHTGGPARGRISIRPHAFSKSQWITAARATYRRMDEANLSLIAAGVGFYAFLSMIPALGAVIAIWGYWADPTLIREQMALIAPMLPRPAFELLQDQVAALVSANRSTLQWTTLLSIALAVWSARAAVASLIRGLNAVHDRPHRQNAIRRVLVAFGLTALLVLVSILAFASVVLLPAVVSLLNLSAWTEFLVNVVKWALLLGVVFLALALVYRYGPNRRGARMRWMTPGAVAAMTLWALGSFALATYFRNFSDLNEVYGSLGAVVGLLLWFWFSALVTLLGAQLNAELERVAAP